MVLKDYIKISAGTLLFIIMVILFSCEKTGTLIVNCSKCTKDQPQKATIDIYISSEYSQALVKIYEGNLEDSVLYSSFTWSSGSTSCQVTLNKKYTFTAKYHTSDGKYYIAVNSVTPKISYFQDQCNEPCYYIYNNVVNLKLKYTK